MTAQGIFVTGTDTGVGKTVVSALLLTLLRAQGIDAVPMKPVQTGAIRRHGRWRAPDLDFCLALADLHPSEQERRLMAPYCFRRACSPHLAAALAGQQIKVSKIMKSFAALQRLHDFVIVEGAGGVLTPLSGEHSMLEVMKSLALPVVLVAKPGLGTINHTLLTLRELRRAKLNILGVVINYAVKTSRTFIEKDNLKTIERLGDTRIIAELPFMRNASGQGLASSVCAD